MYDSILVQSIIYVDYFCFTLVCVEIRILMDGKSNDVSMESVYNFLLSFFFPQKLNGQIICKNAPLDTCPLGFC